MSQKKIEKWDAVNGNESSQDKLTAFLDSQTDAYAILQLRRTDDTWDERFMSLSYLHHHGKDPNIDHYEVVYVGALAPYTDQAALLEGIYTKFNIAHPQDFRGHSLSVSDIVALNTAGVVSSHYVDSIGFAELPSFLSQENHLKNAEMAMEDDYGIIDGIINNGRSDASGERRSVLEQLKEQPPAPETPRKPPRRTKERDME